MSMSFAFKVTVKQQDDAADLLLDVMKTLRDRNEDPVMLLVLASMLTQAFSDVNKTPMEDCLSVIEALGKKFHDDVERASSS